jgi:hypothetical protein
MPPARLDAGGGLLASLGIGAVFRAGFHRRIHHDGQRFRDSPLPLMAKPIVKQVDARSGEGVRNNDIQVRLNKGSIAAFA